MLCRWPFLRFPARPLSTHATHPQKTFTQQLRTALALLRPLLPPHLRDARPHTLSLVSFHGHALPSRPPHTPPLWIPAVLRAQLQPRLMLDLNHYAAHAALGFHTSPFRRALVVILDGGWCSHFLFNASGLTRQENCGMTLEVAGAYQTCTQTLLWGPTQKWQGVQAMISDMRRFSELATLEPPEVTPEAQKLWRMCLRPRTEQRLAAHRAALKAPPRRRAALAAGVQRLFNDHVVARVAALWAGAGGRAAGLDGVVFAGGLAGNTVASTALAEALHPVPVHVPFAPGDAGISLGAAWFLQPPEPRSVWQVRPRARAGGGGGRVLLNNSASPGGGLGGGMTPPTHPTPSDPSPPQVIGQIFLRVFGQSKIFSCALRRKSGLATKFLRRL